MRATVRGYSEDHTLVFQKSGDNERKIDYNGDLIGEVDALILEAFFITNNVEVEDADGYLWSPV